MMVSCLVLLIENKNQNGDVAGRAREITPDI